MSVKTSGCRKDNYFLLKVAKDIDDLEHCCDEDTKEEIKEHLKSLSSEVDPEMRNIIQTLLSTTEKLEV